MGGSIPIAHDPGGSGTIRNRFERRPEGPVLVRLPEISVLNVAARARGWTVGE